MQSRGCSRGSSSQVPSSGELHALFHGSTPSQTDLGIYAPPPPAQILKTLSPMMHRSPMITALYLRDYFYIQNVPAEGDEAIWRKVECAAIRITESVSYILGDYSRDTQLREAKRVRRAARECVKHIPRLHGVEPWTWEVAVFFESLAETKLKDLAKEPPDGRMLQH